MTLLNMLINNSDFSKWCCEKFGLKIGDVIKISGFKFNYKVTLLQFPNILEFIKLVPIGDRPEDDCDSLDPCCLVGREFYIVDRE